eukprot:2443463-Pyramimonas_sp.AAC.1
MRCHESFGKWGWRVTNFDALVDSQNWCAANSAPVMRCLQMSGRAFGKRQFDPIDRGGALGLPEPANVPRTTKWA